MSIPDLTPTVAKSLWYRALASEIGTGIQIREADRTVISNKLYEARQAAMDPELEKLILINPGPHPDWLWIVKKAVEL